MLLHGILQNNFILMKKYTFLILSLLFISSFLLNVYTCNKIQYEKKKKNEIEIIHNNNLIVMQDSLKTYYDNKLEKVITEKTSYLINDINELSKYNVNLYNDLKDVKDLIAGISGKISVLLPNDESDGNVIQLDTNTYRLPWSFDYSDDGLVQKINGRSEFKLISGKILPLKSYLDTNYYSIKINYVFNEKDEKYVVWATSPSKYVKFEELDGVLKLDKVSKTDIKSRRLVIAPTLLFGINSNIIGKDYRFGWGVGISIGYNLLK